MGITPADLAAELARLQVTLATPRLTIFRDVYDRDGRVTTIFRGSVEIAEPKEPR